MSLQSDLIRAFGGGAGVWRDAVIDVIVAAFPGGAAIAQQAVDDSGLTQVTDGTLAEITFNATWSQGQADTIDKNFAEITTALKAAGIFIDP